VPRWAASRNEITASASARGIGGQSTDASHACPGQLYCCVCIVNGDVLRDTDEIPVKLRRLARNGDGGEIG
jgi:hypothetical protein